MKINGEEHSSTAQTLGELLTELEIDSPLIAIELNREVIPRSLHHTTALSATDEIEIIHAIGGG